MNANPCSEIHLRGDVSLWEKDAAVKHESLKYCSIKYREQFNFILCGDYDEVLKAGPQYTFLKKFYLERIKDEDLPLFLHYDWHYKDLKDEFLRRLYGLH